MNRNIDAGPPPIPEAARKSPNKKAELAPVPETARKPETDPTARLYESASRPSKDHPGRNEDAALGKDMRMRAELAKPPELHTGDVAGDLAVMRAATARELKAAPALQKKKIFGVLDGVSGKSAYNEQNRFEGTGAVASRLASAAISERLAAMPDFVTVDQAKAAIQEALQAANASIKSYTDAAKASGRGAEMSQVGTTASIAKLIENADGTTEAVIGSVGDSRVYKFDGETKKLVPLTVDENMIGLMLRQGRLTRGDYDAVMSAENPATLPDATKAKIAAVMDIVKPLKDGRTRTPEQAVEGAKSGLANSLSGESKITVGDNGNVFSVKLKRGDRLLLSSDGLHDQRTDAQIEAHLAAGGSLDNLMVAAYESGRKPDDITAELIEIGGGVARPDIALAERRAASETSAAAAAEETRRGIFANPLEAPSAKPADSTPKPASVVERFKKLFGRGKDKAA